MLPTSREEGGDDDDYDENCLQADMMTRERRAKSSKAQRGRA